MDHSAYVVISYEKYNYYKKLKRNTTK